MSDTITTIINRYDIAGKYLDSLALNELQSYFDTGITRINIARLVNSQSAKILKNTATKFYIEEPELLEPGGNSYTTRKYAACLRDIEYYLRYASYAIMAGKTDILDERVLNGLRETYKSLGVPLGPTIRSIEILRDEIIEINPTSKNKFSQQQIIAESFNHMIQVLSEQDL